MASVADLRPRVAAQVPNCPNPAVDRAIVDAARDLCNAAPIWRDTITVHASRDGERFRLVPGLPDYEGAPAAEFALSLPSAYALIQSIEAQTSPDPVVGNADGELARVIPPGVTVNGRPFRAYRMDSRQQMTVTNDPGDPIVVHVSLRPFDGAKTIPDAVAIDYRDGIVSGALSYLLAMPAEPWGNPSLAQYHHRNFRHTRSEAKYDAERGFEQTGLRAQPRAFANFRGRTT